MLMRWDPFVEMNRFQDDFFRRAAVAPRRTAAARPAVDIRETETQYVIAVEVPGVPRENLAVEVDRDVLTVRGERKVATDEADESSLRRVERYHGSFARSFSLPTDVDAEAIEAALHDGVLELTIPKRSRPSARAIEVKAA
jgi:HSP20 family protein